MTKSLKIKMYIIDNEFGLKYDYIGYFVDASEFTKFLNENIAVGNIVTVLKIREITRRTYEASFR